MNDWGAQDLQRRLANLIRVATLTDLDDAAATARVACSAVPDSAWLPILAARAGPDRSFWLPEPGEQVLVLSPSGDPAQGVILPAGYQDAHGPPAATRDTHRVVYADGTTTEYDRAAHTLTVDCVGSVVVTGAQTLTVDFGGRVDVTTPAQVTVDAPLSSFNGDVAVNGDFTVAGGYAATITSPVDFQGPAHFHAAVDSNGHDISSHHKHSGVQTGGDDTGEVA